VVAPGAGMRGFLMPNNLERHHRRSIRLKGYDYSLAGAYFVTIVTQHRACLFGEVVNGEMLLNDAGKMLQLEWNALPQRFPNIELDEFVVMPNHFHGILVILGKEEGAVRVRSLVSLPQEGQTQPGQPGVGQPQAGQPRMGQPQAGQPQGIAPTGRDPVLGEVIGAWKSIGTDRYIDGVNRLDWEPFDRRLFQRNYYEHIVRDECELNRIREYIINNPANWDSDDDNPKNAKPEPECGRIGASTRHCPNKASPKRNR
jgi:putative transposase